MEMWDICLLSARSDAQMAERLAKSIREYRMPSGVAMLQNDVDYRKICLDTKETAFGDQVREQLEKSRFLIFLCSPDAKNSEEVNRRLEAFRNANDRDHMIAVIVRGEPGESFPESFIERKMVRHILPDQRVIERMETIEPIAADLRADNEKQRKQMLRYETVRIVASIMSLHPDDLEQRQRVRQKKTRIRILSMTAAIVLFLSGIFFRLGLIARKEGRIAGQQTQLSVETAKRTIEDLPKLFADEPLALGYIQETVQHAKDSLAEIGLEELFDSAESGE